MQHDYQIDSLQAAGKVLRILKQRFPNLKAGEGFDLAAAIVLAVLDSEADAPRPATEG